MNEVNERKIILIYIFCYLKPYIKVGNSPCYIYYSITLTNTNRIN